jgi:DNA-directed RNA polymerase specialized sigma subunit
MTDLELWTKWKQTKSKIDLDNLTKQMMPLIKTEVQKHVGVVDYLTLETEALLQAKKAFESYKPSMASVATHLVNSLKKINRLIYQRQSVLKVPEAHVLKWNTYNIASQDLKNKLGREPTFSELKDHLGWSANALTIFQKYIDKSEFSENKPIPKPLAIEMTLTDSHDKKMLAYMYHDLSPQEQLLFEMLTGYGGVPIAQSASEIMKKLKINQNQLSYQKKKLIQKIEGIQHA